MEQQALYAACLAGPRPGITEVVDRLSVAMPEHPGHDFLGLLLERVRPLALSLQKRFQLRKAAQWEGPTLAALGGAGLQADPTGLKVHLGPAKTKDFAFAPPGEVAELGNGPEPI